MRALLIVFGFTILLAFLFAFQSAPEPLRIEVGQASSRTILAPDRIIYQSEIQMSEARTKAEADVVDVYDPPDAALGREQVRWASRVMDYVDLIRRDASTPLERKIEQVQAIPGLIVGSATIKATFALDDNSYHRVVTEALYVLELSMRDPIRPNGLISAIAKIPNRVSLALPVDQADLVNQWCQVFIVPNSFPNPTETNLKRALARAQVEPIYRTIEKGQAILRQGEVVTPLTIEALLATGFLRPQLSITDYLGPILFAVLLSVLLTIYMLHLRRPLITQGRVLMLVAVLTLFFAAGVKFIGVESSWARYLFPISAGAMLLTVLVDSTTAVGVSFVLALAFGFLTHSSLEGVMYALTGCIIAALSLERIERLPSFLWSGLYVGVANAAVGSVFRVVERNIDVMAWAQMLAASIGNGALSGLLALGSLFIFGKVFDITTSLELLDLARPTHPLLKKLLLEVPGTYHHSLIVSQLAEQAAQRIGADGLLVRVGAYYHDVGKMADPQSFVENQLDGINVHDTLGPRDSARIVIEHVSKGISLAKRYGLPARLIDFIPQHHGTTLAAYFHRKALKANGDTPIDENDYRYPGPKPQSRETAILMLADGVEATARAERPTTPDGIRAIIDRIFSERLRDGQLDESDLTLRDLQVIKQAFFDILQGLYHPRVKYPEPEPPRSSEQTHAS
ncbi:MAG: HDIG domain-containing protein [Chloroflexi bacterium]|nr:HDIG domain-containing protein [Chloroflexota bacterium]